MNCSNTVKGEGRSLLKKVEEKLGIDKALDNFLLSSLNSLKVCLE